MVVDSSNALGLISLLDVFTLGSQASIRQRVIDSAAEQFEAEIVGIVCGETIVKAIGIGNDPALHDRLLAVATSAEEEVAFGPLGKLHLLSIPIEGDDGTRFVVARSVGPLDHVEIRICRAMVRLMRLAVRTISALDEQRQGTIRLKAEVARNQALNRELLARHGDLMKRMLDIQETLSSTPGSVLTAIFQQGRDLFGDDVLAMHLVGNDGLLSLQHLTANAPSGAAGLLDRVDPDEAFVGLAIEADRLVCSSELDDPSWIGSRDDWGIEAGISAPVHQHRNAIGTMTVLSSQEYRQFSTDEHETLLLLAGYASVAVSDARIINEREQALAAAEWQATHDPLTGLANRRLVLDVIAERLDQKRNVVVLYIDVDRFKSVNDLYGHQVGDEFIQEVGRRLQAGIRPTDLAGRLAGDEFIVVLEFDPSDPDGPLAMAERLRSDLNRSVELNGRQFSLSISVGLATSEGLSGASDVINAADVAMYKAKSGGRNQTGLFDEVLQSQIRRRAILAEGLETATATGKGLSMVYQPIVGLGDGDLRGHESLLRYVDPVLGPVTPDEFIPLAEELGIIGRIDDLVLDTALSEASLAGIETTLSVNVSPGWLADPGVLEKVVATAASNGFPLDRLTLEVTERAALSEAVPAALARLRKTGVKILLDDFGTGYSSLAYVRTLEIDGIKIDKGFLDGVESDRHSAAILEAVVTLTDRLGAQAIAEGVESAAQAELLLSLGCRVGQGYYFGRPVPAADAFAAVSGR